MGLFPSAAELRPLIRELAGEVGRTVAVAVADVLKGYHPPEHAAWRPIEAAGYQVALGAGLTVTVATYTLTIGLAGVIREWGHDQEGGTWTDLFTTWRADGAPIAELTELNGQRATMENPRPVWLPVQKGPVTIDIRIRNAGPVAVLVSALFRGFYYPQG